jgi:glutaredoxin
MVERVLMREAVLRNGKTIALAVLVLLIIALTVYKGRSYFSGEMNSGFSKISPADKGTIIVYGSKTCPWCVKQEKYLTEKGIPYEFVDCTQEQCPEFVQGFPTLSVNGEIKHGYTEI